MGGWVAPGYELVQQVFAENADLLGRGGGAYAAYVGGQPVVDLWAGQKRQGVAWDHDTTTVLFSATKTLSSMCSQILYDRGLIDFDAPVSEYWPEFAANGKEKALLRHIPLHSVGVMGLPGSADILSWHTGKGWDRYDEIEAALAGAKPIWEPGSKHGYHAITFGWLIGAIVRRVSGVSIGQFFDKEIAQPLGLDIHIGTPASAIDNVAKVYGLSSSGMPKGLAGLHERMVTATADPSTLYGIAFLGDGQRSGLEGMGDFFSNPEVLAAELPFGGGTSSARSMAKLFATLANGGELDGTRIFDKVGIDRFTTVEGNAVDELAASQEFPRLMRGMATKPTPRSLGFMGNQLNTPGMGDFFGPNPNARGAQGLGGQVAFFDADNNVSAAFVRSDPALIDTLQAKVTAALYSALEANGTLRQPLPKVAPVTKLVSKLAGSYASRAQRKNNAATASLG